MRLQPPFPDAVPDAAEAACTGLSGDVQPFPGHYTSCLGAHPRRNFPGCASGSPFSASCCPSGRQAWGSSTNATPARDAHLFLPERASLHQSTHRLRIGTMKKVQAAPRSRHSIAIPVLAIRPQKTASVGECSPCALVTRHHHWTQCRATCTSTLDRRFRYWQTAVSSGPRSSCSARRSPQLYSVVSPRISTRAAIGSNRLERDDRQGHGTSTGNTNQSCCRTQQRGNSRPDCGGSVKLCRDLKCVADLFDVHPGGKCVSLRIIANRCDRFIERLRRRRGRFKPVQCRDRGSYHRTCSENAYERGLHGSHHRTGGRQILRLFTERR